MFINSLTQKNDCAFLPDGLRLPVVMIYDCCLATITKKIHVVVSKKKERNKKIITLVLSCFESFKFLCLVWQLCKNM